MRYFKLVFLPSLLFMLSACGGPDKEQINRDFHAIRMKAKILSSSKESAGSSDSINVIIKYQIPPTETVYEDKMFYSKLDECNGCWFSIYITPDERMKL